MKVRIKVEDFKTRRVLNSTEHHDVKEMAAVFDLIENSIYYYPKVTRQITIVITEENKDTPPAI